MQPLSDQGWDQMRVLLDEHMPVKKNRRPVLWIPLILGATVLLLSVITYISIQSRSEELPSTTANVNHVNDQGNSMSTVEIHQQGALLSTSKSSDEVKEQAFYADSRIKASSFHENRISNISSETLNPTESIIDWSISSMNETTENDVPFNQTAHPSSSDFSFESSFKKISENDLTINRLFITSNLKSDIYTISPIPLIELNMLNVQISSNDIQAKDLSPPSSEKQKPERTIQTFLASRWSRSNLWNRFELELGKRWPISKKLHFGLGASISRLEYITQENQPQLAASYISAETFSNALVEAQYTPDQFTSSSWAIALPVQLSYEFGRHLSIQGMLCPGILTGQKLNHRVADQNSITRSVPIEDGRLESNDFFHRSDVMTMTTGLTLQYRFMPRWSLSLGYQQHLLDVNRGVIYAGSSQLERLNPGAVNRRFYDLRPESNNPKEISLGLEFQF